ncbi:MAG: hypothetical protein GY697_07905 [Desulfobacterales bacterium]|nr:hypothetical protein [Desulfobacterales bacterium]
MWPEGSNASAGGLGGMEVLRIIEYRYYHPFYTIKVSKVKPPKNTEIGHFTGAPKQLSGHRADAAGRGRQKWAGEKARY